MTSFPSPIPSIMLFLALTMQFRFGESFSAINSNATPKIKTFHFGAGCFWAPADKIKSMPGIVSTSVGYCGDDTVSPDAAISYEKVCGGRTKLVEAVRVEYDANQLSYEDLLPIFAEVNTAEYGNKRQYSGVIFTSSKEERKIASNYLEENKQVVASVEEMSSNYYKAEKYHQDYWAKWRTRIPLLVGGLFLISKIGGDMSQTIYNFVCYGFIGFTLIERKIDTAVETISARND